MLLFIQRTVSPARTSTRGVPKAANRIATVAAAWSSAAPCMCSICAVDTAGPARAARVAPSASASRLIGA